MGMTEQENRAKVLKGLEEVIAEAVYPDRPRKFMMSLELAEDALALLKAQEARVMSLEEVQKIASIRDGAIWLEAGAGLMPAFMEFATKDITFFVAVPLRGYRQFFENDWYGKSWRCWDKKPTDAQRKAVAWV